MESRRKHEGLEAAVSRLGFDQCGVYLCDCGKIARLEEAVRLIKHKVPAEEW
jgi:hypothetical protein